MTLKRGQVTAAESSQQRPGQRAAETHHPHRATHSATHSAHEQREVVFLGGGGFLGTREQPKRQHQAAGGVSS